MYISITAPEDPPRNVTVETISERSVLVKWSPPEDINGILESYNLFFNYTNHTPIHQITVLPVYTFFLHEYLKPHQTVSVSMSARTIGGEGPMAAYESTTTYQDGENSCVYTHVLLGKHCEISFILKIMHSLFHHLCGCIWPLHIQAMNIIICIT